MPLTRLWAVWLQKLPKCSAVKINRPLPRIWIPVIINAAQVKLTGKKLVQKVYFRHSGYLGGDKYTKAGDMLKNNPVRMVELAVKGMVPHNRLGNQIIKKLHVYAGSEHPHAAQKPEVLTIDIR